MVGRGVDRGHARGVHFDCAHTHTQTGEDFFFFFRAATSRLTVAARLVVRQALHHSPVTLHPDGANFAEFVERLAFKNHAAAGRGVVVLLQPAGSTTKRGFKKKKKRR